jgi:arabinogalactan oligomer/maltooligosaccharide transport system permease protein
MTKLIPLVTKIFLMAMTTAILGYMSFVAFIAGEVVIGSVLVAIALAANLVYFSRKAVAPKFLFPGIVLLVIFVITPILYTIQMSGYTYKTGNEITKDEALTQIYELGLTSDEAGTTYDLQVGKLDGKYASLLKEQVTGETFFGIDGQVESIQPTDVPSGFTPLTVDEIAQNEADIVALKYELGDGIYIIPQAADVAAQLRQSYVYDAAANTLNDSVNGITYVDNGKGNFVSESGDYLYPGWRQLNPLENYTALILDPVIRGPFVNVFIWTVTFSVLTVLLMFVVGLALAIALDKKIRGRNFYRAILILPYAFPSFMSILIWNGMFNREFGAVNALLGVQIDWYNDALLAKIVILIVNLWLGFPYMYLIATGALQALPAELEEAASIDGASPRQILTQIKLPLLLQILSPLLIASFAFNFNNFNIVYLLTGGGPTDVLAGESAGATDILITYAYKTAFGSTEQNLGLASAISVIMFLIVGALSLWSLKRSKVLEEM